MGCIEYYDNSLDSKVNKSAVATSKHYTLYTSKHPWSEILTIYIIIDNYFLLCMYLLISIYYVAELCIFSFVISLHIDKGFEKKRNICCFNKFCVLFYSYIFQVTHLKLAFHNVCIYIYIYIKYNV